MMQRSVQQLLRPFRTVSVAKRGFIGPPGPWGPRGSIFDELQNRVNQLERDFFRSPFVMSWRPFQQPIDNEAFRIRNPIIEEDGVNKFKLEFDVRRFKPEDVKVSTDTQERVLTIEAKYKDAESSFEYSRKVGIPEGVEPKQITAKYTSEGTLQFEAPYTEPAKPELPKEQELKIEHK